ncbi:hypothetical protein Lmor_3181 [Legionella moravica]|uniref:Uncharacterized protein n=1 Tax=Legionella moravica TaxID=39962 RepID=A0A378JZ19_9GAMM|nr:hypothetical protein [Legionella moravica]KTD31074.1 hypothetical protein Lmor_3181 [Legionella moravica]STX63656.1 Uncharacterised protein [Legionella moravica]
MNLKQFNCRYLLNDDRLILRINTVDQSEYLFWITRRITHFILMSTSQYIQKAYEQRAPSVEHLILEIKQSNKQVGNFTKAFVPGFNYPLGGTPVLVMDAKLQMMKIGDQDVFALDFVLPGGANLNLKLPMPIMKSMILLLEELNAQAKWGNPASK